jgi:uncharacterized damage-inducible protein DinB
VAATDPPEPDPVIDAAFVRTLARYNAWQNRSLYREADALDEARRREDRGAFFGSVHRTLCHILTADHVWMSRFDGWPMPEARGPRSPDWVTDWDELKERRATTDQRLIGWSERLADADLAGDLTWQSGPDGPVMSRPRWIVVTHLFNHQTHHRGQVHALLTGFGRSPDATDLPWMPEDG